MKKKFVITKTKTCYTKEASILAIYENDKPLDISIVYDDEKSELNNIYVGHVKDVVKNINSAFVSYEKDKIGYLSLKDIKNPVYFNKKNTDKVCEGDSILVQFIKEPVKTKFGVLTTDISFTGKYIVFIADKQNNISVSNKIKDTEYIDSIKIEAISYTNNHSVIIRTAAYDVDRQLVFDEISYYANLYESIVQKAMYRPIYSNVYESLDININLIKETICDGDEIVTDDENLLEEIKESISGTICDIRLYKDDLLPLYKLYNIEGLLKDVSSTNIWLKSGAYIVIEYTEAMTVIDVNSGKFIKGKDRNNTFLKVNIEAAHEIFAQLRLRNISGIVMCDFINMDSEDDERILMHEIKSLAAKDRIPVNVLGFTRLKLLELTRKKLRDRVILKNK